MNVNSERLWQRLNQIGSIGADPRGGISRFSWTPAYKEACVQLTALMERAGLRVRMDAVGNLYGRLEGTDPTLKPILTGSHFDTKPMGGRFDGNAGIMAALECLTAMHEAGYRPRRSIEMIAFINEEASEFLGGCFGSRAITGQVERAFLTTCRERTTGQTMYDAMKAFGLGCDPDRFESCILTEGQYHCFIELHIEQGRYLLDHEQSISILEGIAGIKQFYITINGVRAHAGGMSMQDRHDAMAAAGQVVCEIERLALNSGVATRGTCGYILSASNDVSVISDQATLAVDFRELDAVIFDRLYDDLMAFTKQACDKRGLTFSVRVDLNTPPAICNQALREIMLESARRHGIANETMVSYPAHDAHHLSRVCPIAMIFLRSSNGGVSHCPDEFTTQEDLTSGTMVLLDTLVKLAEEDVL